MCVVTLVWVINVQEGEVLRPGRSWSLEDFVTMGKSTNFGKMASMSMPAAQGTTKTAGQVWVLSTPWIKVAWRQFLSWPWYHQVGGCGRLHDLQGSTNLC